MPGIKGVVGGTIKSVGEAVVKPTTDEFGKAIEQGVQSVFGSPPQIQQNPQTQNYQKAQTEQKQKNDELKKRNIQMFLQRMSSEEQALRQKRAQESQRLKQQQVEEKKKKEIKQFEALEDQKKQDVALAIQQRKVEIKRGGA